MVKTRQEKEAENLKVYESAKRIIDSWPEWKRAYAQSSEEASDEVDESAALQDV